MDRNCENILRKLPSVIEERIRQLPGSIIECFEEIRLKTFEDTVVISEGREISLHDGKLVTPDLIDETLNRLLDYSYYAYEEELSKGYITIEGGHRVGLCGTVTMKDGKVHLIKYVSSLNIRRSRQIIGVSGKIINSVCDEKRRIIRNTLIISPPKCGQDHDTERSGKKSERQRIPCRHM